jgi:hypothetical protein
MRRRALLPLILLAIVGSLQMAAASSLPTTSARLGAGTAAVTACDGDGFTFKLTVNGIGRVSNVNVTGVNAACAGGTLKVTLVNDSANVGAGAASLPSSGFTGTVDVAISPQPLSDGVTAVVSAVEGP